MEQAKQMISVVIPMYNEADKVERTAKTLSDYLGGRFERYEVLLVNDGSTDQTAALAVKAAEADGHIKAVGYEKNRGKGCAVRTGMLAAEGDLIFFTDCDLAYGTDVIGEAAEVMERTGCDLLIGSRALHPKGYEGYTALRKLMSKTYLKFVSLVCGFRYSDSQAGFKGFSAGTAKEIFSLCQVDGFAFDLEALMLASRMGCYVEQLPVRVVNHDEGSSKVNPLRDALRMLRDVRDIKKRHRK